MRSELLRETSLFEHSVCGMAGQNFLIDRKSPLIERAVPDFVVAPPRPLKITSLLAENLLKPSA